VPFFKETRSLLRCRFQEIGEQRGKNNGVEIKKKQTAKEAE
jgi:hypothetical protein